MDAYSSIKKSIRDMTSVSNASTLFTAKVKSVNGETCTIEVDGCTLTDVRMRAVINGNSSKILITPSTDSYVLVADLSDNLSQLAVVSYSEVQKIEIDSSDGIIINGGDLGGMIKIQELTKKLNDLVDWCKRHVHSGVITAVSGGSGAPAVGTLGSSAAPTPAPSSFNKEDYEDTKLKH
ncbi:MAG: hypothetical protein RRY55_01310 [Bacteroidales bacterium]